MAMMTSSRAGSRAVSRAGSRAGTPAPSVIGVQSMTSSGSSRAADGRPSSRATHGVAPNGHAGADTTNVIVEVDHTVVAFKPDSPSVAGGPLNEPEPGPDGSALPPGTAGPPAADGAAPGAPAIKPATKLQAQASHTPTEGGGKKKKRKDLIADLDWWSKYYVTKEDMDKV